MLKQPMLESFGDYLTVKEAANLLGVCPDTVRNWDRSGKLTANRHPLNQYRLYRRNELVMLLAKTMKVQAASASKTDRPNHTRTITSSGE